MTNFVDAAVVKPNHNCQVLGVIRTQTGFIINTVRYLSDGWYSFWGIKCEVVSWSENPNPCELPEAIRTKYGIKTPAEQRTDYYDQVNFAIKQLVHSQHFLLPGPGNPHLSFYIHLKDKGGKVIYHLDAQDYIYLTFESMDGLPEAIQGFELTKLEIVT